MEIYTSNSVESPVASSIAACVPMDGLTLRTPTPDEVQHLILALQNL